MNKSFLRSHLWIPLLAFTACFGAIEIRVLDPVFAHAWYFDQENLRWLGAGAGSWWARDVLHTGGRWVARCVAAAALLAWLLSYFWDRAIPWRGRAGFIALGMIAATAIVGLLKLVTNVDCPWDLAGFGGVRPYVPLFADRPDALPRAQCFPGAHASSGFALMAWYFALRESNPKLSRWLLSAAICFGVAFSIGQEARGAHFFSHDLASAALVWFILLALYCWLSRHESAPRAAAAWKSPAKVPAACSSARHPTTSA